MSLHARIPAGPAQGVALSCLHSCVGLGHQKETGSGLPKEGSGAIVRVGLGSAMEQELGVARGLELWWGQARSDF